jgi:heavy metal translocating P-type ATPase
MPTTSTNILCDQCGLPFSRSEKGRGGVTQIKSGIEFRFCCYGCSFTHSLTGEKGEGGVAAMFLVRLGFSAFLSMNIMILSWVMYAGKWAWLGIEPEVLPAMNMLLFVLSTPIMVLVGYPFFKNAIAEIRRLRLSMDSLIALGSLAAYGFSTVEVFTGGSALYFDTGTMVIVLVTAGRYLESAAKVRTSSALHALLELRPNVARVIRSGEETEMRTSEVNVGEIIKVLPGERIALDGIIAEGRTSVNESFLTGESLPVAKESGAKAFAATINGEGAILVRTTAVESDTLHAQFIRLMEEAQRTRSPIQQLVDRVSYIFIPAVIGIAAATFFGWMIFGTTTAALIHSLTVLVVSCPCALGIGTPLATTVAIARAAEEGILIRSTAILERLSAINTVVFDKTGTLTEGNLAVASVVPKRCTPVELLSIAASLECNSEHLIGKAIVKYAADEKVPLYECRTARAIPGRGLEGEIRFQGKWKKVIAGNEKLMIDFGVTRDVVSNDSVSAGMLFVAWDGTVQGVVHISDTLRSDAISAGKMLHERGVDVGILSGDIQSIVDSIGGRINAHYSFGGLLPKEKVEKIQMLRSGGRSVLMVGDGINDAPALASADVGVALGSATDLTKENADITIIGTRLERIPWLLQLGKKTYRIIKWNLFWAFVYNIVGILLAAFGLIDPILAALAMIISSVFIIFNSRRLNNE